MYDFAIVGGGIVGLSAGMALSHRYPKASIVIIEKEDRWAQHQTGHNSGVIHSGIYYTPGSLKAKLARQGSLSMVEFCREYGIEHEICGKVIVATNSEELPLLENLYRRGLANGLQLDKLEPEALKEIEPHVTGLSAIRVPNAGIVNYQQVCEAFANIVASRGGELRLGTRVENLIELSTGVQIETNQGVFQTRFLINCAGLHSDRIATLGNAKTDVKIVPFRGEYYELKPEKRYLVKHLVYPVPNPNFPFLGVHFTRMIGGKVEAGPNAVLSLKREGYYKTDIDLKDVIDIVGYPGFWKLARKYWREGLQEMVRSTSKADGEKVTIKLMQFKVEITDKVKAMADDYMAQNPNVIIEAQVTRDYETLLKTRFASGDEPDLFMTKAFTDITDWSDKLADLSNEPWMSKVSPSAVAGMTVDGKKLGFPVAFEGYGFIYNKDLFAKAGIDKVPTTLSELREVNEKLKAAGIQSYSEGYKEWWVLGQHLFNLPFAYEEQPAQTIEKINKGEAKVTDVANMDGFFEVLDMTLEYGQGAESVGVSYDNQVSDFSSGKTAMMQQGVWTIDSILKINPDINMGMFAIPLNDNASDTRLPVGVPGYYVINKNSKNLEETKKFLNWIHENGQKYLVDSFKLIPAFTDLKTSPDLGPLAADLSAYVEKDQTLPWAHTLWPTGANQEFAKPLQAYVGGQITKEEALAEVQSIWDARVKK